MEERIKVLESVVSKLRSRNEFLESRRRLDRDRIAVLEKAGQDWLDGEPQRLTELDDLTSKISQRDDLIRSLRNDLSNLAAHRQSQRDESNTD